MLDVLADRAEDLVWPLALGLLGVTLTWLPTRNPRRWSAIVIGGAASIFLVAVRGHLSDVVDALLDGPLWFTGVALLAGVAAAAAMAHLLGEGRGPEGLLVLGVGLGAAAAALPDVEVLLGAAALWVPWLLARGGSERPAPAGPQPLQEVVALLVATVAVLALVDGARGRPGSLLIAPIVVGPVGLVAVIPGPLSWPTRATHAMAASVAGVIVARCAGLGSGTALPLIGSGTGLALLACLAMMRQRRSTRSRERGDEHT